MSWKQDSHNANRAWRGPIEKYDLIQEGTIAVVVIFILVVALNVLFGSPLVHSVTFQSWANAAPVDFVATTLTELTGTSESATYGPPYNSGTVDLKIDQSLSQTPSGNAVNPSGPSQLQNLGPLSPQAWFGTPLPINVPDQFVLKPLGAFGVLDRGAQEALQRWNGASLDDKSAWANAALSSTITIDGTTVKFDTDKDTGPLPVMMGTMLAAAQSGALNAHSVDNTTNLYSMDNTGALLYVADGNYLGDIATYYNLQGPQWGVMNEIGSWPGQPWLWWYSMFYNIPGWSSIGTDILAVASALPFVAIFIFLPFIPGLRSIPRWIPLHRADLALVLQQIREFTPGRHERQSRVPRRQALLIDSTTGREARGHAPWPPRLCSSANRSPAVYFPGDDSSTCRQYALPTCHCARRRERLCA